MNNTELIAHARLNLRTSLAPTYITLLADALEAAQPAPQVPMTDREIVGAWIRIADPIALGGALPRENAVREFVRAIEAHFGIGVKP